MGRVVVGWVVAGAQTAVPAQLRRAFPQPPSPPSPDELPSDVKRAYRTFAAVPGPHPPQDPTAQVCAAPALPPQPQPHPPVGRLGCKLRKPGSDPSLQPCTPGPTASPEQLSFRERQKYFELEVRVPQAEGPPKRVSLVGADDLRKMQEEEGELEASGVGWCRGWAPPPI